MVCLAKISLSVLSVVSLANSLSLGSLYSVFGTPDTQTINVLPGEKPVPGDSPVSICDVNSHQILELTSLNIIPNPPTRGANLTVSGVGFLKEAIEEGAYVDVDVRYGYIRLLHQTYDLCDQMGNVDLTCPLAKGEHIITKEVEIPQEVPPGKYIVYARAYTREDKFIACVTATVEFPASG